MFDEADTLLVKDFKDDLDNIMLPLKVYENIYPYLVLILCLYLETVRER